MTHARRLIATLIGCAAWCLASTTVASASMLHDPVPKGPPALASPGSGGAPLWQSPVLVALGVLLAVAIVGMGYSISHSRKSERSPRSHAPLRS
jgi:hypothetical protein